MQYNGKDKVWDFLYTKEKISRKCSVGEVLVKMCYTETENRSNHCGSLVGKYNNSNGRVEILYGGNVVFKIDLDSFWQEAFEAAVSCVKWVRDIPYNDLPLHVNHENEMVRVLVTKRLDGVIDLSLKEGFFKRWFKKA